MYPPFVHHSIPFLPDGFSRGSARRYRAAAVEGAALAGGINDHLARAGCIETASNPVGCDLFADEPKALKSRHTVWKAIRTSTSLRWVLVTSHPDLIHEALPEDWSTENYPHVCLGAIVEDRMLFAERKASLLSAPASFRMLLFPWMDTVPDLRNDLSGIDWVVVVGDKFADPTRVEEIQEVCKAHNVAFLYITDDSTPGEEDVVATIRNGDSAYRQHPFEPSVSLHRGTLIEGMDLNDEISPTLDPSDEKPSSNASLIDPAFTHPRTVGQQIDEVMLNPVLALVPASELNDESTSGDSDFHRLDLEVRRGAAAFMKCGMALQEIHDRKLFCLGGYPTWESYLRTALGMSKPHAHRLVQASRIAFELSETLPIGNDLPRVDPASESQIRPLCRLKDHEQRASAWSLAVQRAQGQPTAKQISKVVDELLEKDVEPSLRAPTPSQRILTCVQRLREVIAGSLLSSDIEELLLEIESHANRKSITPA